MHAISRPSERPKPPEFFWRFLHVCRTRRNSCGRKSCHGYLPPSVANRKPLTATSRGKEAEQQSRGACEQKPDISLCPCALLPFPAPPLIFSLLPCSTSFPNILLVFLGILSSFWALLTCFYLICYLNGNQSTRSFSGKFEIMVYKPRLPCYNSRRGF